MTTLFHGGPIWTGGRSPRFVEALLARDGEIAALGSLAEVEAATRAADRVERFDLRGRPLLPGFIDAHTHFLTGGRKLGCVQLRTADSRAEMARRLAEYAATVPAGGWITGGDWDHELWGGELPTREWIDAATPNHPVWIHRLDIHMTLSNSVALELAGIDRHTPDPEGGEIVRGPDGEPTGILKDTAMGLVSRHLPTPDDDMRATWLRDGAAHALARGVTQVHDVDGWPSLLAYRKAHAEGALPLWVYAAVPMHSWMELDAFVTDFGRGDARLWWGGLKAFVDGSLGSGTAWFHEPYLGEPDNTGLVVTDLDELLQQMVEADRRGLQLIVHAIGDRANDWLLDAFQTVAQRNGPRDRRSRTEHAQHLSPDAIGRFGRLGVIPSVQPAHLVDDGRWAEDRVGPERACTTYAFRSLAEGGARLAFGSDWTVADIDPIATIAAAVTRQAAGDRYPGGWNPQERVSVEAAFRAHTLGAAHAGFSDAFTGCLAVGRAADLVVLDRNPFAIPETELSSLSVEYTFVGGALAYRKEAAS